MAWIYLFVAGLCEMGWTVGMKYSHGFSQLLPSIITIILMGISMFLLAHAVKTIPLGVGYAVWTGIGIVGTALASIFLFHDSLSPIQIVCVILIATGIIGMRVGA